MVVKEAKTLATKMKKMGDRHNREMVKANEKIVETILINSTEQVKKMGSNKKKKSKNKEVVTKNVPMSNIMKKRAKNIKRNAAKMKELNEKYSNIEKNTVSNRKRVVHTSRGAKKQKPTEKRNEIRSQPKLIIGCIHDHGKYSGGYKEETDKGYCKEGYDLHGIRCKSCNAGFGWIEGGKFVIPSNKKPIYICVGRGKYGCTFGLCCDCYTKKSTTTSKRRTSRHT